MTIQTIAKELVSLCKEGKYQEAHEKLYHPNAYSEEPMGDQRRVEGMEAISAKGEWWANTFETHGVTVSEPIIADDFFSVIIDIDVTNKESGVRNRSSEVAVYEVTDGKIVGERFFFR